MSIYLGVKLLEFSYSRQTILKTINMGNEGRQSLHSVNDVSCITIVVMDEKKVPNLIQTYSLFKKPRIKYNFIYIKCIPCLHLL